MDNISDIPDTCNAVVFDGQPGVLELRKIQIPRLNAGEILVQVDCCTLCGSDLHSIDGRRKVPIPTILGHEIVGTVVDFDETETIHDMFGQNLNRGDRITWAVVANCGDCYYCRNDLPQKCLTGIKYGHEAIGSRAILSGGLAEYCILAKGTKAIRVPRDMPLGKIAPASCATATIAAMFDAAAICQPGFDSPHDLTGKTVCIFGAGMLGLTAAAMATWRKARDIVCVDINEDRLRKSESFGASHRVLPADLPETLTSVTDGKGADIALELSGAADSFKSGFDSLRIGGVFVLAGAVFPGPPVPISMEQTIRKQITIRGVHNYAPKHLATAVEFLSETSLPFDSSVDPWLTLAELPAWLSKPKDIMPVRVGIDFTR